MKKMTIMLTLLSLVLSSCIAPQDVRSSRSDVGVEDISTDPGSGDGDSGTGIGAGPDDSNSITDGDTSTTAKVEITQIVDPNTGTFRKKVTIPKDFEGYLYLSGLNISSLKSNVVSVRFYLGLERTPITIPAVIGRAPGGLSPLSSIDVLILDVQDKPFRNVRLLYDLFDYNDYKEGTVDQIEPTNDPTNAGLYCRGLKLEDDPTFEPLYTAAEEAACISSPSTCVRDTACDENGEQCLYAYAKIGDSTLYTEQSVSGTTIKARQSLSYEQFDVAGDGYSSETSANNLLKCLPDNDSAAQLNGVLGISSITSPLATFTGELDVSVGGSNYKYDGPFLSFAQSLWQISGDALFSDTSVASTQASGLFRRTFGVPPNPGTETNASGGYFSFLFPRAAKLNYSQSGVQYYGSSDPFDTSRTLQVLPGAGDTLWMDGCNLRIKNYDEYSNETISSCSVSASMEVITNVNGKEEVLVSTNEVKLQLIKAGLGESTGLEFSAMKQCNNGDSRSCGTGECCFNSRCWSRELVGQCGDDFSGSGNMGTGESCGSDFDCSSLCCNQTTGVCQDHYNDGIENVLCSKVPGQSCLSREFCRIENVRECYIIKTIDANGNNSCEKKCYTVPTFGDCVDGTCRPPTTPDEISFDITDPNRCAGALDKPPIAL